MHTADQRPLRERLADWVEHLAHILPAQAPIRDFVHHNTLHGFQHLPFPEALAAAQQLTGVRTYWPESRFRQCLAEGRVTRDDLAAALEDEGVADLQEPLLGSLTRRDILLASLMAGDEAPGEALRAWQTREQPAASTAIFSRFSRLTVASPPAAASDLEQVAAARLDTCWARLGCGQTGRALLAHLSGEDVLERVRSILQRHLAAHLDLGVAAWRNPARAAGFFAAWRASAGVDLAWEIEELPDVRDEIMHLPDDPVAVLAETLPSLMPDEAHWYAYLERLSLEMPGWSGMFLWRDRNPAHGDGTPVAMVDYLAVRVLLERMLLDDLLRRLGGGPLTLGELRAHFAARPAEFIVRDLRAMDGLPEDLQSEAGHWLARARLGPVDAEAWRPLAERMLLQQAGLHDGAQAARMVRVAEVLGLDEAAMAALDDTALCQLCDCASSLSTAQRGQIWLLAYERHYREQLFGALAANRGRNAAPVPCSAQVVFCMDDREEGTRRHLEEIAPDIATYGAAGFFGVAMYWQGIDDPDQSALCPVVVTPRHLVRELAVSGFDAHAARRERRLQWRERLFQSTRRHALAGPLLTGMASVPALASLAAVTLAPAWLGETWQRWRTQYDGPVQTRLALTADTAAPADTPLPQGGFTDVEQVDRVAAFLRMIGLTANFAPLVLVLGHGSGSQNNPHLSAYDCGACSGKHGGPNARAFAAMANRPAVRAGLVERGIVIPDTCWFVAAEHNTCDDGVAWYDLEAVPAALGSALDTLLRQLAEACRAHAAERCRRLASAPLQANPWQARQHMSGRASDISQARPELGHATNAAAFIGRRQMSRGLFLDRRVFLISYDPQQDDDGRIVENILLAAGPVGAGIALEYYFSSVDNERLGCGSKITHNITGLFGVMEGADSDLRTGLPWQMVEIHEPMRLLVVVEQETDVLTQILERQPPLQELINHAWIVVAAQSPTTGEIARYCPRRGWLPWSGSSVLPQVARSADWFAGMREALPPALILGAASA